MASQSLVDGIFEIIIANRSFLVSHTMLDSKSDSQKSCKNLLASLDVIAWTDTKSNSAPFLDEVMTPEDRGKVTIMEGPKIVRELVATGIQIIK